MGTSAAPLLEVCGLVVRVRGEPALNAPLHLALRAGEAVRLGGPSGVGKSLSLKAICAPLFIEAQGVAIDGVVRFREGEEPVYSPQGAPALDWLSVEAQRGSSDPGEAWPAHPRSLSGGQRARLAIARALDRAPALLVLDEPAVGLDPDAVRGLVEQLVHYVNGGGALLFVSHNELFVRSLASRLAMREVVVTPPHDADEGASPVGLRGPAVARLLTLGLLPGRGGMRWRWAVRLCVAIAGATLHPKLIVYHALIGAMLAASATALIAHVAGVMLDPAVALKLVAWRGVQWLAPALAAMLASATIGAGVVAWSGQQSLASAPLVLVGLGFDVRRALYANIFWLTLLGGLVALVAVLAGLISGVSLGAQALGLEQPALEGLWGLLLTRTTLARCALYPLTLALVTSWHASAPFPDADAITRAMLKVTMTTTLLVVLLELASVLRLSGA